MRISFAFEKLYNKRSWTFVLIPSATLHITKDQKRVRVALLFAWLFWTAALLFENE